MTELERLFFPADRTKLAQLVTPEDGESDIQWLARIVAAQKAVVVTSADAREPGRYRARAADAMAQGAPLVIVQEDAKDSRLRMNPGAGTPQLQDQAAYLAARRAGRSPDEAVRVANDADEG